MKKIWIILLSLLLYSASGYGQEIVKREYFMDTDPGAGNGTSQTFNPADSVTDDITFSVSGLNLGFHRIYTRYQYNNGSWGIPEDRLFYIYDTTEPVYTAAPEVNAGEYFFDTDPGVSHGTAVPGFATGDWAQQTITFSTVGLGVGFHRIYTRYVDVLHRWGIAEDRLFYVYDTTHPVPINQAPIVAGEYFFDNEPGPGNGTPIIVTPAQDSVQQTLTIAVGSLSLGVHYLYLRYKDTNGKWGIAEPREFQVCIPPAADIVALGDTTFCFGSSVTLQADTGIHYKYQWQNDNVNLPGDTSRTLTVQTVSGQYDVIITNDTGCTAASNLITVTAGNRPTVTTNGSDTVCSGDTVVLTSSAALTYSWTGGGNTQSIHVTQTGNYTVTVTTANNCTTGSNPVSVLVNPAPATPIVTSNGSDTICSGDTVVLTSSAEFTYSWTGGGTTQSINVAQGGTYTVTATNANDCSASSNPVTISVSPAPATPTIIFAPGTSILSTQSGFSIYGWYYSSDSVTFQQVPSATSDSLATNQNGYYYVQVANSGGCTATSAAMYYLVTGIAQIAGNGSIVVYPNPASDEVMLQGNVLNNTKTTLLVRDITGKIMEVNYELNADKIKLHVTGLASGVYIATLRVNEEEVSLRFVKE